MSLSQPLLKQDSLLRLALEQLADWNVGAETVSSISLLPHRGAHRVYRVGITTEKGAAIDSFYVEEKNGGKLLDPQRQIAVEAKIRSSILNLDELCESLVLFHGLAKG